MFSFIYVFQYFKIVIFPFGFWDPILELQFV